LITWVNFLLFLRLNESHLQRSVSINFLLRLINQQLLRVSLVRLSQYVRLSAHEVVLRLLFFGVAAGGEKIMMGRGSLCHWSCMWSWHIHGFLKDTSRLLNRAELLKGRLAYRVLVTQTTVLMLLLIQIDAYNHRMLSLCRSHLTYFFKHSWRDCG